eukprot:scaffold89292_cov54-Attheya_sp.AAC.1
MVNNIDDIKSSHVDSKVNDKFLAWLEKTYGEDGIGSVKTTRGKRHDYLAMVLEFNKEGKLVLDMWDYVKGMVNDWESVTESLPISSSPWTEKLFKVDKTSPLLAKKSREIFHTFVMKGMFLCKRARQDIQTGIVSLSSRTSSPNKSDWNRL